MMRVRDKYFLMGFIRQQKMGLKLRLRKERLKRVAVLISRQRLMSENFKGAAKRNTLADRKTQKWHCK